MKTNFNKIKFIFLIPLALILFQNCGTPLNSGFKSGEDIYTSRAISSDECMKSSKNACIFNKSSVSTANAPVTDYILGAYLDFGVQINDTDGSGFLQNSLFSVQTLITNRKNTASLKNYPKNMDSTIEQAMAYYYVNEAISYYSQKGSWSAKQSDLKIYVDSNFSGFVNTSNSIHLKKESRTRPIAYDASMILFYLNQANAVRASSGQILSSLSSTAKNCFNSREHFLNNGCCQSTEGCGAALYLAQADYLTALFFLNKGQSTAIAETYVNQTAGSSSCGISRNPAQNAGIKLSQAYNACANSKGLNSAMAGVYSSIWWEVRKSLSSTDQNDLDQLFLEHLKNLKGSMTFSDAISAAQQIDQTTYSSRFSTLLANELSRRRN